MVTLRFNRSPVPPAAILTAGLIAAGCTGPGAGLPPATGRVSPPPGVTAGDPPSPAMASTPSPRFEAFPPFIEIAPEAIAADLDSHPRAREFRSTITEAAEAGADFAGHLAVARWSCGTDCQQHAFIDARDGRVIWGPRTRLGADFVQHSRLFVLNPADDATASATAQDPRPPGLETAYMVWNGERLVPLAMELSPDAP